MTLHVSAPTLPGAAPSADAHWSPTLPVLIVDDQPAVRQGLMRLLRGAAGLPGLVLHEAASLDDARRQVQACQPRLVLLDVDLAGEDGLQLLPLPCAGSTVVVVSSHARDASVRARALAGGAAAVLDKAQPGALLADAVRGLLMAPQRGPST